VAAHHGSLSRRLRLDAERRLKNGELRVVVATASRPESEAWVRDLGICAVILSITAISPIMFWRVLVDRVMYYGSLDTFTMICIAFAVSRIEHDSRNRSSRIRPYRSGSAARIRVTLLGIVPPIPGTSTLILAEPGLDAPRGAPLIVPYALTVEHSPRTTAAGRV